ncbi:MAG: undecaprenyl/decaprenyl-phosphate alpha-N-acetylglucosaminyl 1-phosphate transferase, partial [Candidatus Omnitrophica bacterium]|nr:undecaprenyl/decaprenyl-phosphate alpha-N-acetylglucosaminyl 1-phosphate transferase [Candidatus Omnitrophota bacterium]
MNSSYYFYTFLICIAVSFIATPAVRKLARLGGFLDKPNRRKVHRESIASLGGMAIFISFLTGIFFVYHVMALTTDRNLLIGLLIGASAIVLLGVYDDIKNVPALLKLAGQVAVASIVYYYGFRIEEFFGLSVDTPFLKLLSYFVTVGWIVGAINAINLLDGLDGLACGITAIVAVFLFTASFIDGNYMLCFLTAALAGSCLGFLPYNLYPASIFMGDTGSMLLGLVLALVAIESSQKSTTIIAILVPMIAMAVPLIDTFLSILRRLIKKKPLFKADKNHIHHRLLMEEKSQMKVVLTLYSATCFFGLIALGVRGIRGVYMVAALVVVSLVTFRWMRNSGFLD